MTEARVAEADEEEEAAKRGTEEARGSAGAMGLAREGDGKRARMRRSRGGARAERARLELEEAESTGTKGAEEERNTGREVMVGWGFHVGHKNMQGQGCQVAPTVDVKLPTAALYCTVDVTLKLTLVFLLDAPRRSFLAEG